VPPLPPPPLPSSRHARCTAGVSVAGHRKEGLPRGGVFQEPHVQALTPPPPPHSLSPALMFPRLILSCSHGEKFSQEELEEMLAAAVDVETGRIYYEDFAELLADS
jgi:hypothetical protein